MATTTAVRKKKKPRRRLIVAGIEHGFSGYTNYGCRCDVCLEADRQHHQDYRDRKFAGNPLCIVPGCPRQQSRAHGYGLCYKHGDELREMRHNHPIKAKRIATKLGIDLKPIKSAA